MRPDESERAGDMAEAMIGADGHLDEGAAHAFVDGALSADEAARVAEHLDGCARCAALVAEARGLAAAATGVIGRLDDGPGAVLLRGDGVIVPARGRRPAQVRAGLRVAAAALLVAGIGGSAYLGSRRYEAPVERGQAVSAQAPAAEPVVPAVAAPRPAPALVPAPAPDKVTSAAAEPREVAGADSAAAPATAVTLAAPALARRPIALDARARAVGASAECFIVTGAPSRSKPTATPARFPSPLQLDTSGVVLADGAAQGAWARVHNDSLQVTWRDSTLPVLVVGRDGRGWTDGAVRLAPQPAGRCGPP
ncbi:hypothetical protein tb265_22720 [Gemmatimonadetes bacterium T265]|nr:hypothetical protein tb265_22720 [Gemmatimonadetes bacterium T265]